MRNFINLFAQNKSRLYVSAVILFLVGCSSTQREAAIEGEKTRVSIPVKGSGDFMELLTGFGEAISHRDFDRAVAHLIPFERALILDANGNVPASRKKDLMALPLHKLIRSPTVRVENNYLAGIYDLLPSVRENAESKETRVSIPEPDQSPTAASN